MPEARRPRTLRRQLLIWLTGPLVVLWSVSSIVDYEIASRFVNLAYDRALLESALNISRQVKVVNNRVYVDLPEIALKILETREHGRVYYRVTSPKNQFITGEHDLPPPPDMGTDRIRYYDDILRDRPIRVVALRHPVQPGSGRGVVLIQVAERVTVRTDFAQQIILGMVLPQAVLILITALLVWYAVGRGLAPLTSLRREIENRSHRDLSALPEQQAPQEVQPLIRAMNDLLTRLGKALAAQRRFITDAAHQLRTPVAGIKTQTELALRQTQSGEAQNTLRQLHAATEQTTRLINQLLTLARAEPEAERPQATEPVDLGRLARDVTTEWVPRALARNIDLGFDGLEDGMTIEGDPLLLREMLNNLIDNAIRYTPRDGRVTVRVAPSAGQVVLSVEDNGPGIPVGDRERVFERFYRVLGTGVDGCGLGLAIVKEISQSHGAEISLDEGPQGVGTVARVSFPAVAT
ncbi:MAG: sensor histidine kinase N-terminal domain-containing protein [Burkholderiales bacterium]|nr:sensor histidine kinase N-terminal domain-containing protein [Burkholderiales bacterium]